MAECIDGFIYHELSFMIEWLEPYLVHTPSWRSQTSIRAFDQGWKLRGVTDYLYPTKVEIVHVANRTSVSQISRNGGWVRSSECQSQRRYQKM